MSYTQKKEWTTPFERSFGMETPTYWEGMDYYRSLAQAHEEMKIMTMGLTDSGEALHLVLLDFDRKFDLSAIKEGAKPVILINNGIHAGESDGIDASMQFLRDCLLKKELRKMAQGLILAIVPYYNIGGALNRNSTSRTNQNGPKTYGFRGNAQNYDLNRDFIKMDSRNAHAFAELFHRLRPDIFIDTHVSNGADYQYRIMHLITQHEKLGGALGKYTEDEFTPTLEKMMMEKEEPITPFVNVYGVSPDQGFPQFMDHPRYSTGYTTLFHTLGMMIETHMLKPYAKRVRASYRFLESILTIGHRDGLKIRTMRRAALAAPIPGKKVPLLWKADRQQRSDLDFKGYRALMKVSQVTGLERMYYDRSQPYSKTVPYYNHYKPALSIKAPWAYILPQGWVKVIDRLKANGVEMQPLEKDTTIMIESYRIKGYKTYTQAYEGHYPHYETNLDKENKELLFRKGDLVISTDQEAGLFLVATLEPQAIDSYFNWNFFDTILQQKEGFSSYVFEEVAEELLAKNPDLKAELQKKRAEDPEFAKNGRAQLAFLHQRSPHYEKAHLSYPVYRWSPKP